MSILNATAGQWIGPFTARALGEMDPARFGRNPDTARKNAAKWIRARRSRGEARPLGARWEILFAALTPAMRRRLGYGSDESRQTARSGNPAGFAFVPGDDHLGMSATPQPEAAVPAAEPSTPTPEQLIAAGRDLLNHAVDKLNAVTAELDALKAKVRGDDHPWEAREHALKVLENAGLREPYPGELDDDVDDALAFGRCLLSPPREYAGPEYSGHGDLTADELADELGVSREAVIEHAEKRGLPLCHSTDPNDRGRWVDLVFFERAAVARFVAAGLFEGVPAVKASALRPAD